MTRSTILYLTFSSINRPTPPAAKLLMKARGRRPSAFIVFECLETKIVMFMLRSIVSAKTAEKTTFQVFCSLYLSSLSSVYL